MKNYVTKLMLGIFTAAIVLLSDFSWTKVSAMMISGNNLSLDERTIIEEERIRYQNDEEFLREAKARNITIEQLLKENASITKQVRQIMKKNSFNYGGVGARSVGNHENNFYVNIPLIQQTEKFYCGQTSALQALYGLGCAANVAGSSYKDKIDNIVKDFKALNNTFEDLVNRQEGIMVYMVRDIMNYYSPIMKYRYLTNKNMTENDFRGRIETSLVYNAAPILHAQTKYLSYYGGKESGHYIVVSAYDRTTNKVTLKDCNYTNKYYGEHSVPLTEALDTITKDNKQSRYLIYLSY